eukprot:13043976-Heterocapsa_arctica.AAC.1
MAWIVRTRKRHRRIRSWAALQEAKLSLDRVKLTTHRGDIVGDRAQSQIHGIHGLAQPQERRGRRGLESGECRSEVREVGAEGGVGRVDARHQ